MNVILTENILKVGKYICNNVTIIKTEDGFEFTIFDIDGITQRKPIINKSSGIQEVDIFTRKPLFKRIKQRKKIKSKYFEYFGDALKESEPFGKFNKYLYKQNKKGNYINYYEVIKND